MWIRIYLAKASKRCTNEPIFSAAHQQRHIFIIHSIYFYFILQISWAVDDVTCELGALTTWGEIPDVVTVPVGGKFLLVTEAHEKVYEGCSKVLLGLPNTVNTGPHFQELFSKYGFDNNRHGPDCSQVFQTDFLLCNRLS